MANMNDGGPAFPSQELNNDGTPYYLNSGMTLRDYFAGKAMNAGIAFDMPRTEVGIRACAAFAYQMADAMLAAREVKP